MADAREIETYRSKLWWLCYRMTGVAADADELVQETFLRVLESPPADQSRELLPWLRRIAVNASRDLLRRRKLRSYVGDWLPSPVELDELPDEALSPAAHYGQRESLSYAFLIAIEALSEQQRAVLLLRDVLDYSVLETAQALGLSESNVKTSHHRARAALRTYEQDRRPPDIAREGQTRAAMVRLMACVALGDAQAVEALLAESVMAINDADGEFHAAGRPVFTRHRVARMFVRLGPRVRVERVQAGMFNGLPGIVTLGPPYMPNVAPMIANLFDIDASGAIVAAYSVLASRKIGHLALARA
jgi:RNA polymerase sigma-70 factor (ECF subfamily)